MGALSVSPHITPKPRIPRLFRAPYPRTSSPHTTSPRSSLSSSFFSSFLSKVALGVLCMRDGHVTRRSSVISRGKWVQATLTITLANMPVKPHQFTPLHLVATAKGTPWVFKCLRSRIAPGSILASAHLSWHGQTKSDDEESLWKVTHLAPLSCPSIHSFSAAYLLLAISPPHSHCEAIRGSDSCNKASADVTSCSRNGDGKGFRGGTREMCLEAQVPLVKSSPAFPASERQPPMPRGDASQRPPEGSIVPGVTPCQTLKLACSPAGTCASPTFALCAQVCIQTSDIVDSYPGHIHRTRMTPCVSCFP